MAEDALTENLRAQIATYSQISTLGIRQLLNGDVMTKSDDRMKLLGYVSYMVAWANRCPPPPKMNLNSHV